MVCPHSLAPSDRQRSHGLRIRLSRCVGAFVRDGAAGSVSAGLQSLGAPSPSQLTSAPPRQSSSTPSTLSLPVASARRQHCHPRHLRRRRPLARPRPLSSPATSKSLHTQGLAAAIIAPRCPLGTRASTRCHSASVIDHLVVSPGLSAAAALARPVPGWPGTPHRPIVLSLAADFADLYVLRFSTHAALPADIPWGLSPHPHMLGSRPPGCPRGRFRRPRARLASRRQKLALYRQLLRLRHHRRQARGFGRPQQLRWTRATSYGGRPVCDGARAARAIAIAAHLFREVTHAASAHPLGSLAACQLLSAIVSTCDSTQAALGRPSPLIRRRHLAPPLPHRRFATATTSPCRRIPPLRVARGSRAGSGRRHRRAQRPTTRLWRQAGNIGLPRYQPQVERPRALTYAKPGNPPSCGEAPTLS